MGTVLVASLGERDRLLGVSSGKRPMLLNVLLCRRPPAATPGGKYQ